MKQNHANMSASQIEQSYGNSITLLSGMEAVRRRPEMYLGNISDGTALHQMVLIIVDVAVDEVRAGHCDRIEIILNNDNSVTVRDNGRGIPTNIYRDTGLSFAEFIIGELLIPPVSTIYSRNIANVSVVNALSEKFDLHIWRNGKQYYTQFLHGVRHSSLSAIGSETAEKTGTEITFLPSSEIFSPQVLNCAILEHRLRTLALENKVFFLRLTDARQAEKIVIDIHVPTLPKKEAINEKAERSWH